MGDDVEAEAFAEGHEVVEKAFRPQSFGHRGESACQMHQKHAGHVPVPGVRQREHYSPPGGEGALQVLAAFQVRLQLCDELWIAVNGGKPKGLAPVAHVGAHAVTHQRAGDVFRPDDAGEVPAQLFWAAAIGTGAIRDAAKEAMRNPWREPMN